MPCSAVLHHRIFEHAATARHSRHTINPEHGDRLQQRVGEARIVNIGCISRLIFAMHASCLSIDIVFLAEFAVAFVSVSQ